MKPLSLLPFFAMALGRIKRWLGGESWKESGCGHSWRGVAVQPREFVTDGIHVSIAGATWKICDLCDQGIRLSAEEFYAQFGRMPW